VEATLAAASARYAGEETIREARCRKIAVTVTVTVTVTPAEITVWADGKHVRQIQAVTPNSCF